MVRLEKIVYEKIFNSQLLSRARQITAPKKRDFRTDRNGASIPTFKFYTRLMRPIRQMRLSIFWNYFRQMCNQRGIPMSDIIYMDDVEARRCVFTEQVTREAFHPYNRQINSWKRMGYGKVEMALEGFEAPEYIQSEVKKETYFGALKKRHAYDHFLFSSYIAEMTPITFMGKGSHVILDFLIINNFFKPSAWSTYFFNEDEYLTSRKRHQDMVINNGYLDSDVYSEGYKKRLKSGLAKWNRRMPGYFAPEGEEVDFDAVYGDIIAKREWAVKEKGYWEQGDSKPEIYGPERPFWIPESGEPEEKGVNNVGKVLPGYLRGKVSSLMQ